LLLSNQSTDFAMSQQTEKFGFTLKATDGMARRGRLTTAWGAG
jgi:hypothetical protein